MAQLDLLTFINTHPSPGSRDNINFWITTGSQGEFFLNGVTIPLEAQESELATIISQADKLYLDFTNEVVARLEGPYIKQRGTISSTTADPNVFGNFTFFIDDIGVGDTLYVLDAGTLQTVGTVNGISDDGLLSLDTSGQYGYDITDAPFYTTGSQTVSTRVVFSQNNEFYKSNKFTQVPDRTVFNGLNEYWFNFNPFQGVIASEYSVKIDTQGINVESISSSFAGYTGIDSFYNSKISSKEKITSGSLYHYYVLFENPILVDNSTVFLTSQSLIPSTIYFEPSFNRIFAYNDYEVLGNDVQEIRKSNTFLKVDRNFSQLNPTNFEVILDGNSSRDAEVFAEVQDSYYDSVSWNRSRYEGSSYQAPLNSLLPAAHYAVPLDAYIFDTEVSSSALLEAIKNGIQQFPSISSMYFYTPVQITNTGNEFALQISSSALSSTREKITITRISSSGAPAPVTATGEVVLSFFTSNTQGGYGNSERKLFISASIASGSLEYDTRSEYERLTNAGFYITEVSTQVFSRIVSTNIPNTDLAPVASIKTTPDSRLPGLTVFLLDREERTDMIPLAGKKVYDPKTKILYETDGQGLLISTFV